MVTAVAAMRSAAVPAATATPVRWRRTKRAARYRQCGARALIGSCRQLELRVDYRPPTDPGAISPLVALTIYRVVQEALTNVVRHARASRVEVRVHDDPSGLAVTVCEDGVGPPPGHRAGNGLSGLSERVDGAGGTFRHGPGRAGSDGCHRPVRPVSAAPVDRERDHGRARVARGDRAAARRLARVAPPR